jgi:NADPH:quinone reductase-like Zn-dependent oxidoreductase
MTDAATTSPGGTMWAMRYDRYGPPAKVLQREVAPKPVPEAHEVLVRVRAASVNPLDWHMIRGEPLLVRSSEGWRRPKRTIPGVDVAGIVEAVGRDVTRFRPGDEVWGHKGRALAEYVCARETLFLSRPRRLSLEQSAAIPAAAITALQALRDTGAVRAGHRVLINGASGGVGTFAVQLAKHFGADVTAVTSTPNVELVRGLGADRVIDYTASDFTRIGDRFDIVMDNVGNRSLPDLRRLVAPGGIGVMVGAMPSRWLAPLPRIVGGLVLSRLGGRRLRWMLAHTSDDDMAVLADLVEAGAVTPVIDRCYPMERAGEALAYLETLRARGKVILTA